MSSSRFSPPSVSTQDAIRHSIEYRSPVFWQCLRPNCSFAREMEKNRLEALKYALGLIYAIIVQVKRQTAVLIKIRACLLVQMQVRWTTKRRHLKHIVCTQAASLKVQKTCNLNLKSKYDLLTV